jgi:hypothetical protein
MGLSGISTAWPTWCIAKDGVAVVHIFRFEGERIAELWDVGPPVPAENPNTVGMF